jgi:hypothetical protein
MKARWDRIIGSLSASEFMTVNVPADRGS